jgi:hypothetical protein
MISDNRGGHSEIVIQLSAAELSAQSNLRCGACETEATAATSIERMGRHEAKEVRLMTTILQRFNVSRKANHTVLRALEKPGVVKVHREPRRNPVVSTLDAPYDSLAPSHS